MVPLGTRETFPGFNEYEVYIVEFDQTVLFNHALTAMYGMNTYIFLADNDEVLAIVPQVPAPAIHNLLMHGMLGLCYQDLEHSLLSHHKLHRMLEDNASGIVLCGISLEVSQMHHDTSRCIYRLRTITHAQR